MVALPEVQVPGYGRAIQHESRVRDSGFDGGNEIVAGVEVAPLSLRRLLWLERARNGFVVPCRFDDASEQLAHALQVLYFCRPTYWAPVSPVRSLLAAAFEQWRIQRFTRATVRRHNPQAILEDVGGWLDEAFMDAPRPPDESGDRVVSKAAHASYPAYIVTLFAAGGMTQTVREIMEMPLKTLWQYVRLLQHRVYGMPLSNPSDVVFLDGLERARGKN
jgi:hypothetical protein